MTFCVPHILDHSFQFPKFTSVEIYNYTETDMEEAEAARRLASAASPSFGETQDFLIETSLDELFTGIFAHEDLRLMRMAALGDCELLGDLEDLSDLGDLPLAEKLDLGDESLASTMMADVEVCSGPTSCLGDELPPDSPDLADVACDLSDGGLPNRAVGFPFLAASKTHSNVYPCLASMLSKDPKPASMFSILISSTLAVRESTFTVAGCS